MFLAKSTSVISSIKIGLIREVRNIVQVLWFTVLSWDEFPRKPTLRWTSVCRKFLGALSGSTLMGKGRRQDQAKGDAGLQCSLHHAPASHRGVEMTLKVILS